jgi:type I restriction enzyme S subunit
MNVPKGYKMTEVGVIPEDWEVKKLGDIAIFLKGRGLAKSELIPFGGEPCIHYGELFTQYPEKITEIISQTITSIPNACRSVSNDVLMPTSDVTPRGLAKASCLEIDGVILGGDILVIRSKQGTVDGTFLSYMIRYEENQVLQLVTGSTVYHLYASDMKEFIFSLPTLAEQQAIARVLSDTDALINALDKLIAKKRDIKKAVMQELLTGKTRLPGFSGEWEVKKLGDLGIFLKGSGVKKNESLSGDLPCIRYGEIYTKYNYYIKEIYSYISHEVASTATKMEKNDILFAGSGETKEEIGKCVAFVHDLEAYAGGDIIILRPYKPYKIDSIFLGYYLNSAPISKQKASKGQGDAVVHISTKALSMIEVKIPSVDEQRSIAQILSDIDSEITALEKRRDKMKALKQGMMQELLTGRIRLH